jgi:hypothetical protein
MSMWCKRESTPCGASVGFARSARGVLARRSLKFWQRPFSKTTASLRQAERRNPPWRSVVPDDTVVRWIAPPK